MNYPEDALQKMDGYLSETYSADGPGAAVLIAVDGKPVFRKGYGLANLELGVPIQPETVFRIGSVTKQFTAVSILMLMERGLLSLTDDLTRFLPDYPTQGHKITIEHLLTHTSGITSYTELPEWGPIMRQDLSLDDLMAVWKDKPMKFAPGERWSYNNSAYVMLGAVIEKASGMSYEAFLQDNIFTPLGMSRTYFDMSFKVIPGRASGYSKGPDGYVNSAYLSMTQPHAAGSLASCVDDLLKWDQALYSGKLLQPETLARAHSTYHLNSGDPTGYGYGWMLTDYQGHRVVEHGGGINGFLCDAKRLPDEHLYVVVLTNADSGLGLPELSALKLLGWMLDKPFELPAIITLPVEALNVFCGKYEFSEGDVRDVLVENGVLIIRGMGRDMPLDPFSEVGFRMREVPQKVIFLSEDGQITGMKISGLSGPGVMMRKVA